MKLTEIDLKQPNEPTLYKREMVFPMAAPDPNTIFYIKPVFATGHTVELMSAREEITNDLKKLKDINFI